MMNSLGKHCFEETEKGGNARILGISSKLAGMLGAMPRKGERIFNTTPDNLRAMFNTVKKRVAMSLQNPRLLQIHFHTLRHWKTTMEYHRMKDLLHVEELLGHRSTEATTLYIQLDKAPFNEASGEYHSSVAKTVDDARKLVETGFEYVCTYNGTMLFRKRK